MPDIPTSCGVCKFGDWYYDDEFGDYYRCDRTGKMMDYYSTKSIQADCPLITDRSTPE